MDIRFTLCVALTLLTTQADKCLEEQQCSNCSNGTQQCITDCFPGYFDRKCKSPCSKNCKYRNCSLTERGIPKCSEGCDPGFRGTQCNHACTSPRGSCTKCRQGCDGTFCHLTSSCVSGCHDSYYGSNCKTCSGRCRSCNRITGTCDTCHDPYHGLDCQFSCENCSKTDCVQTCAPGLYGNTCSKSCSKTCLPYPAANTNNAVTSNSSNTCTSECQRKNGECINDCVHGWSGPKCSSQVQCGSNCIGCNQTGACVDGCLPGYYGDECKPCSGTCFNHTCHPRNGSCDSGCIHGQYGQFCKQSCLSCPGGACHPITGICAEETKGNILYVLVIGVTSTACVLLIVGILVILFHCCRKTSSAERDSESVRPDSSRQVETLEYYALHRYWDIEDYDEVSQPQDQQQGPAEEGCDSDPALPGFADQIPGALDTEDSNADSAIPVLADYLTGALDTEDNNAESPIPVLADYLTGALDTEDNNVESAIPVLADYLTGALDNEENNAESAIPVLADYFPGALETEDNVSDPAIPVLADYFPVALDTEDNSGDISGTSSSGSQSYTHLMRDVCVDPRTTVTYISPAEDNT